MIGFNARSVKRTFNLASLSSRVIIKLQSPGGEGTPVILIGESPLGYNPSDLSRGQIPVQWEHDASANILKCCGLFISLLQRE